MTLSGRDASSSEVEKLARVWYDAWRDAHLHLAPPALARARTLESFTERMAAALPEVRVLGDVGNPLGFHLVRDDELNQLFVAATARGTGAAHALIADAEWRLSERGVEVAWLACAIGNDRAARFYEKCGWRRAGVVTSLIEIPEGTLPFDVWRYEKSLRPS